MLNRKIRVRFGPQYYKFNEAKELIACGGAISVTSEEDFSSRMNDFLSYSNLLRESGKNAKEYVIRNLGATQKIYEKLF